MSSLRHRFTDVRKRYALSAPNNVPNHFTQNIDLHGSILTNFSITTGLAYLAGVELLQGDIVTGVTFLKGPSSTAGGTHCFGGLLDPSYNVVGQSVDDTSATPWNSNTIKSFDLTTPYVVPADGMYYAMFVVVATTPGFIASTASQVSATSITPLKTGVSSGTYTTPGSVSSPVANAAGAQLVWCAVYGTAIGR